MLWDRKAYSGVEVVRMARDSGLIFAEQPRRRRWPLFVLAAGLVLGVRAIARARRRKRYGGHRRFLFRR